MPALGPLGTHSQGKIDPHDDGDLALGVMVDGKNKVIRIDFGTEVTWIGLDLKSAKLFVAGLANAIRKLESREPSCCSSSRKGHSDA